jgi:hypothetical protein
MNTTFILMAQYNTAIIPLDLVARDYFQHLSPEKLWRKYNEGAIDLPIISIDPTSNKSAKGVALTDLARFIDTRMEAARLELKALRG